MLRVYSLLEQREICISHYRPALLISEIENNAFQIQLTKEMIVLKIIDTAISSVSFPSFDCNMENVRAEPKNLADEEPKANTGNRDGKINCIFSGWERTFPKKQTS